MPRVSGLRAQVQYVLPNPVRFTSVTAQVQFSDRTLPVRESALYAQVLVSLKQKAAIELPLTQNREINPYRGSTPLALESESSGLTDYLREQAEHVRAQHNITQAGDSTFPWEELTKIGQRRLYTLGSLGRFFHDKYGIIFARYVQFTLMSQGDFGGGPVGLLRTADSVDWRVTNQYLLSSPYRVMGILASYTRPQSEDYGWVIVCGANITSLQLAAKESYVQDGELTWGSFEELSSQKPGKVLGRAQLDGTGNLAPGQLFINIEGLNVAALINLISAATGNSTTRLDQIETHLSTIDAQIKTLNATDVSILIQAIAGLRVALTGETLVRVADVKAINDLIAQLSLTYVNQSTLTAAIDLVETHWTAADAAQGIRLDSLDASVAGLAMQLALGNIPGIILRLDQLQAASNALGARITAIKSYLPVVVGVPPALVYLSDGRLIFTELT